ncbi:50S ribosomal protein L24e [Candidatus Anstonella stagnisolia]|nr:50S ribosomal protein L24e [Candidatus Anstonella stagnisolia]
MFCSFCNNTIARGTGMLYVRKDGSVLSFCSQKCKRNLLHLGREGRLTKWTNKGLALAQHEGKEKKESVLGKEIADKLAAKKDAKK